MLFAPQNIALLNLIAQLLLTVAVVASVILVLKKRNYGLHRMIMRIVFGIQLVLIVAFMWPSLAGYIQTSAFGTIFRIMTPAHHAIGLVLFALFILLNLWFWKVIYIKFRVVHLMRTALALWLTAWIAGIYIYMQVWR